MTIGSPACLCLAKSRTVTGRWGGVERVMVLPVAVGGFASGMVTFTPNGNCCVAQVWALLLLAQVHPWPASPSDHGNSSAPVSASLTEIASVGQLLAALTISSRVAPSGLTTSDW